jgi:membrane fusion protein (multidrug efflux system)
MAKKIILTTLGLLLVVGGLAGVKVLQFKTMFASAATQGPPPEAVAVVQIENTNWQPTLEAVGSITAVQGVTLSAEVPGTIKRIAFESGTTVKQGAVLVELDSATEQAQLEAAEANAELARTNLESGTVLKESGAIAETQYKTYVATAKQAEAELTRLRSVIAKKTIRAPFAGRTGLREINLGQFVGNGDALVSLQSPDPVFVDFALPQQRLSELEVGLTTQVVSDAFPDSKFEGELTAIQPEVEASTRNVRLRALMKNPQGELRPGMYVRTEILLPRAEDVLVVPVTAITYAPFGDSVFVVRDAKEGGGKVVEQKFVRLGRSRGDFVAVTQGLSAGDWVVVTGSFKLRNGSPITVNNSLLPKASETPNPDDT